MISNDIKNARAMENLNSMKARFIWDFKTAYTNYHKNIQLSAYYNRNDKHELAKSCDILSDKWAQRLSYVRDILVNMFDMSSDDFKPIAKEAWEAVIKEIPDLTA